MRYTINFGNRLFATCVANRKIAIFRSTRSLFFISFFFGKLQHILTGTPFISSSRVFFKCKTRFAIFHRKPEDSSKSHMRNPSLRIIYRMKFRIYYIFYGMHAASHKLHTHTQPAPSSSLHTAEKHSSKKYSLCFL